MKKFRYITVLVAMLLGSTLAVLYSCKGETKKEYSGMTDFEAAMTNEDSVAIVNLIDDFFGALESGDLTTAVAMLYKTDNDSNLYAEPELLDNEEMAMLKKQLSSMPVYDHKIDYIKFYESYLNEVKCTATISPSHDNVPAATTSYYFKPINYMGAWLLCLMNSNTGDSPFVSNEDKDSLTRHYQMATQ